MFTVMLEAAIESEMLESAKRKHCYHDARDAVTWFPTGISEVDTPSRMGLDQRSSDVRLSALTCNTKISESRGKRLCPQRFDMAARTLRIGMMALSCAYKHVTLALQSRTDQLGSCLPILTTHDRPHPR